jgi:hypothetical protein
MGGHFGQGRISGQNKIMYVISPYGAVGVNLLNAASSLEFSSMGSAEFPLDLWPPFSPKKIRRPALVYDLTPSRGIYVVTHAASITRPECCLRINFANEK